MTRLYASAAALLALAAASGCAEGSDMGQSEDPATMGDGGSVADSGAQGGEGDGDKDGAQDPDGDDGTTPTMDSGMPDGDLDASLGIDAGRDAAVASDGGTVVEDAGVDATVEPPMVVYPDMILSADETAATIALVDQTVPTDSCFLADTCVDTSGPRRLLQFTLAAENIGEGDLVLGDPDTALGFRVAACSGTNEFEYYTRFELKDSAGATVRSRYGFGGCIAGTLTGDAGTDPAYGCDYQGIPAGGVSISEAGTDCQWLDITGLAGGNYSLVVSINPWRKFAETNYDNNTITVPVTIPTPPPPSADTVLAACTSSTSGRTRDCGWAIADQGLTCTPGQQVTNACGCNGQGVCSGDTVMRICPGNEPCLNANALGSGDDECGTCSQAAFICPASGTYTVLVGAYSSTNTSYTCDPVVVSSTPPPVPGDPTSACASSTTGRTRDCGWTVPSTGRAVSCRPGESITTACGCNGTGTCSGDTVMRICDGGNTCLNAAAIASGDDDCGLCSSATFNCPASGQFTIMVGPYNSTATAVCEPAVIRQTPLDPLAACTANETGKARDCGWNISVQGGGQTCTPGATVSATCGCGGGVCEGDTMMRVCDGTGACLNTAAIASGDDDCGLCAKASFTCPTSGTYTLMVGSYKPGNAFTCEPAITEVP